MHDGLRARLLAEISDLIDAGSFTNGPQVAEFERAFAAYCGTADCVGLASGLDALRLVLLAAGVEPGDEVIVPANTFIATLEAVTQAGATPVPVDVTAADYNINVAAAEAAVTAHTRCFLPVHLYGQLADVGALRVLADRTGLTLFEDACQAHGAKRDGVRAGTAGLAAAFSFYPPKNLGAMGDAGALVTDEPELAAHVRALREHGQRAKYRHDWQGYTARLDTIQALVLLRKLPHLNRWNEQRRAAARFYGEALAGVGDVVVPPVPAGSDPVWRLYVVRTANPEKLAAFLAERGVGSGRHYPEPVHLSAAYAHLGYGPGDFQVTETLARETLSLPIFPGITDEQLAAVVDTVAAYFADVG